LIELKDRVLTWVRTIATTTI